MKKNKKKKPNPPAPRMKRLTKSTGWMKAKAVKIVRQGGQMRVLVKKAKVRRRK